MNVVRSRRTNIAPAVLEPVRRGGLRYPAKPAIEA